MMAKNNKKIYLLSPTKGGVLKQHFLLAEEFRKNGYNICHRYDFWGWIGAHFIYGKNKYVITALPFIFRFPKSNFFLNIHGNYKKERDAAKNPLGYLYDLNKLWSEKIIVPTNYLKDVLKIDSAIVIPNGIGVSNFYNNQPTEKTKNEIALITVTSFDFEKKANGVLRIIKALSAVKTDKKIVLNIFGSGILEKDIENKTNKIKLPENINVFFNGYLKNIRAEYDKSDIFVYWSDLDNMPMVFLEAMSFGLPIITNNFPSFSEIIGEGNFVADNEDQFSKYLEKLINNTEIFEIKAYNKERAIKYNISNVFNQWLDIIK